MKKCTKCLEIKNTNDFEIERNVCKKCRYQQKQALPKKQYEVVKQDKCCTQCNTTKSYTEFNVSIHRLGGLHPYCKECRSGRNQKLYIKNSTKVKQRTAAYYKENKSAMSKSRNERSKIRRKTDPMFLLKRRLRNRLYHALRSTGWNKTNKFAEYIGCSQEELKLHIEKQFTKGMTWENTSEWHIDHIIPLASVNTEEELYKLCHYTNLQPLWAFDNIKKSDKI